jgi:signal transduction histidine kinase
MPHAVKYSPAGGTVTIASRNDGDAVIISVRGEGIGIGGEELSHLRSFRAGRNGHRQPYRGHRSRSLSRPGVRRAARGPVLGQE